MIGEKYVGRCVEKLLRAEASKCSMERLRHAEMKFRLATQVFQKCQIYNLGI